jgi:hypothetical protein
MSTKFRVKFIEQSKTVVSETLVESDELSKEDVLALAKEIALQAQDEAREMGMRKI